MDRILKEHFDRFMKKGLLPPELSKLTGYRLFDDETLLKQWRSNFKGIQWADSKGNLFRGAIDNLLVKGKKMVVLDYKTRGYPLKEDTAEHYQDQMDIYNFLLRKNGYETEDYTYLIFYHPHKIEDNGHVCFNTDLVKIAVNIKNAERIFNEAVKCLENDMPQSSEECGFCEWADNAKSL